MAGLSGKTGWIAAAKQTAKGAAAATPAYKNPFSGGNIGPVRETDRLSETDTARDQGAAYVTTSGVEGAPEIYVRDDSLGFYLAGAMGGVAAPLGTAPNFTHTITLAEALAYHTLWRNVGGTVGVTEQFVDCFMSAITVAAEAGAPLTATVNVQGLTSTFLTTQPAGPALAAGPVYNYNEAAVQLGGAATRLIRSFELSLENNVSRQQTDDVIPYDVVAGTREITLGFDMVFENADEYRKFHYGGAAGTAVSSNIFTTDAKFTFTKGVNNEIVFDLPSIAYEEFPVDPDPGGDPIVVACRAVAQKASGVTNLLTATLKNQVVSYV